MAAHLPTATLVAIESGQDRENNGGDGDDTGGATYDEDDGDEDGDRLRSLCRFPLLISDSCHPACWIRNSHALDEHSVCHKANLYALTDEYRLKLVEPLWNQAAQIDKHHHQLHSIESSQRLKAVQERDDERDRQQSDGLFNPIVEHRIMHSALSATNHKYDIKHFCANYIDNMNLYEIKIIDMPTIEPISEFPTSSLLEWSLFKGRSHLLTADAYLLVFDLTRPSTIQYIKMLRDKIFESREMSNVPVYVIANKADLCPTLQPSLQARQMRNVAVRRHQASLNQPGVESSTNASDSNALPAGQQQGKAVNQQQAKKSTGAIGGTTTEPKWRLFHRNSSKAATGPSPAAPPPPTTFNLAGEQRSVPAAAARQLLTAYKMHRMRLGGTGPIVSLRRWAKLRRAVALHEPKSFGAGLAGFAGGVGGASYMGGASSNWSQFERKRMHYSLIIGASSGLDSRLAGGPGSSRMGKALGRVRSCLRGGWRLLRRNRLSCDMLASTRLRGRTRSRLVTTSFQRSAMRRRRHRRRTRRRRSERIRDHTELALIEKAKRRKSSVFMSPFTMWHQKDAASESTEKKAKKNRKKNKIKRKKKVVGGKNKSSRTQQATDAAAKRLSWARWLHFSAPGDLMNNSQSADDAEQRQEHPETLPHPTIRPSPSETSDLAPTSWRASGGKTVKKRISDSISVTSSIPNSKSTGILRQTKQNQHTTVAKGIANEPTNQSVAFDNGSRPSDQSGTLSHSQQRDSSIDPIVVSNVSNSASNEAGEHKSQTLTNQRPLAQPICGAMSTPACRQTFYDLFNKLLQTSSTTAAKIQLKIGAINAHDQADREQHEDVANGVYNSKTRASMEEPIQVLQVGQQEKQAQLTDKKSKRRKSSSTGAALWQTLSSLALSRISQSSDRKNSNQQDQTINADGCSIRANTSFGGRLSVASRLSAGSGATIFEEALDQQQQQQKKKGSVSDSQALKLSNRRGQTQMSDILACEGLRLGTDQYLSVDMLRKLSLISSHSQLSGGDDVPIEHGALLGDSKDGQVNVEHDDESKRSKSALSEPTVGVASALRRASRAWNLGNKHKKQQEEQQLPSNETDRLSDDESTRPHTSDPTQASTGARRFWYRGVVKKILFHSNKQSLKGIVTAIELQKKAEDALKAAESPNQEKEVKFDGDKQQQPNVVVDAEPQPGPSTSESGIVGQENKIQPGDSSQQPLLQPRRQSLTVVQSAPSIRIISSGSSLSLISENNICNSNNMSTSITSVEPGKPVLSSSCVTDEPDSSEVKFKEDTSSKQHEISLTSKRTLSASSSATSLASSSASLSDSVTINIDTDNKKTSLGVDGERCATNTGSGDSMDAGDEEDEEVEEEEPVECTNNGKDESGSSSDTEDYSGQVDGLVQPELTYQLRKLSADDCLIINRHRRQSLAALQDEEAIESLRKRSHGICDNQVAQVDSGVQGVIMDAGESGLETEQQNQENISAEHKTDNKQQRTHDSIERVIPSSEEGRRQSIKQSIEAAIHLLVPRAKARSASITLGATDCERRSRSQLGTTIMGAVNVHKTWRDWRQLLGRKKSSGGPANNLANTTLDGNPLKLDGDKNTQGSPSPFANRLLSDNLGLSSVASPPIVGFLSSHVAYKKLSADKQREAAINFDQLMRINQLTLTAANVVMLAASQPPIKPSTTQTSVAASSVGGTIGSGHPSGGKRQHQHPNHSKKIEMDKTDGIETSMPLDNSPSKRMEKTDDDRANDPNKRLRNQMCGLSKNQQQPQSLLKSSSGLVTQPLKTRLQSSGNLLLRKSSLSSNKTGHRSKKRAAQIFDGTKMLERTGDKCTTKLFDTQVPLDSESCLDATADIVRAQSAAATDAPAVGGTEKDVSSTTAAAAAAAAAAATAAANQAPSVSEGDISAQIAAAAASALERQRRRGEKISSILEPRYDKKQPGAEYPIFVSHDLNPILKDLAQLVRKHWKCNYIECSAASNWNIRPIISELTRALECNNRLSSSSSGISVGAEDSERSTRAAELRYDPLARGHLDVGEESGRSGDDDVWSSDDDYDVGDSSMTSSDESSYDFISSDGSDVNDDEYNVSGGGIKLDIMRGTETKGPVRLAGVAVGGRRRSKLDRATHQEVCNTSPGTSATRCAIM